MRHKRAREPAPGDRRACVRTWATPGAEAPPGVMARTLSGKTAVVASARPLFTTRETPDPEFKMELEAILRACQDAGIGVKEIDVSPPSPTIVMTRRASRRRWVARNSATADGVGGGGGGGSGRWPVRPPAWRRAWRHGGGVPRAGPGPVPPLWPGCTVEPGPGARRSRRPPTGYVAGASFACGCVASCGSNGIGQEALRGHALTSYAHAQRNPRAVMYGCRSRRAYDKSRWSWSLPTCSTAAWKRWGGAVIVSRRAGKSAAAAAGVIRRRCRVGLSAAATVHNASDYPTSTSRPWLSAVPMAGVGPGLDVLQCYRTSRAG